VRLQEKGGKQHEMPAHHLLESYIDAYVTAAGPSADKTSPLFRTLGGRGRKELGAKRMTRQDARRMIVHRAREAGMVTALGCHTFRATGMRARVRQSSTIDATINHARSSGTDCSLG
jgi:integrase/recombinase XerD